jgi:putative glycosyltransferase (TIGR04348 family)
MNGRAARGADRPCRQVVLVTPALAEANNGNWQTARRWATLLSQAYPVSLCSEWQGEPASLMIALHARRSAASIARWKAVHPHAPLVVVLTGTDLYRDIPTDADADALRSLALADRLVVLNTLGAQRLAPEFRHKVCVVLQSCTARQSLPIRRRHLRVLMVGHLRDEKAPQTYFEAVRQLADRDDLRFDHIGQALDPGLGQQAQRLMSHCPQYRWLGGLPHSQVRRRIQQAGLLVHPSRMEGGAHVVIEAIRSGTAVLASGIDGNVGLLGEDYEGYFPVGHATALAHLIASVRDVPGMLEGLRTQVSRRAPLFDPLREQAALLALLHDLLSPSRSLQ